MQKQRTNKSEKYVAYPDNTSPRGSRSGTLYIPTLDICCSFIKLEKEPFFLITIYHILILPNLSLHSLKVKGCVIDLALLGWSVIFNACPRVLECVSSGYLVFLSEFLESFCWHYFCISSICCFMCMLPAACSFFCSTFLFLCLFYVYIFFNLLCFWICLILRMLVFVTAWCCC